MTSLNESREAVYQLFNSAWAGETPVVFDADSYDSAGVDQWVRLSVRNLFSSQETFGSTGLRKFERQALAGVELFFKPNNVNQDEIDRIAQKAKDIFEGNRISGTTIRFNDTPIRELGVINEWYVVVVEASFIYNETK